MTVKASLRDEALRLAQHARARGLTQSAIAAHLQASQSQISRIFAGTSKRRSKLFAAVCEYVFSDLPGDTTARRAEDVQGLYEVLDSVWDGSPEHAEALAGVIRSLEAFAPRNKRG
jgi:hypothetical protein